MIDSPKKLSSVDSASVSVLLVTLFGMLWDFSSAFQKSVILKQTMILKLWRGLCFVS